MVDKVIKAVRGTVEGKRTAVLGLTFKPKTDDIRDALSLEITPALQRARASASAYDPQGCGRRARALVMQVDTSGIHVGCEFGAGQRGTIPRIAANAHLPSLGPFCFPYL